MDNVDKVLDKYDKEKWNEKKCIMSDPDGVHGNVGNSRCSGRVLRWRGSMGK